MLRAVLLRDQASHRDFHLGAVSKRVLDRGFSLKDAWQVTESDDWTNIQPNLRPWLTSVRDVMEFRPNLLIIDGDPRWKHLPIAVMDMLVQDQAVIVYLQALPSSPWNDEQPVHSFQQVGFPLAHTSPRDIATLATSPNDYDVRLDGFTLPTGVWSGSGKTLGEILAHQAYILNPEDGPFRPLLRAPTRYDAKDPVWRKGESFGGASKPYCFAGVRREPVWAALFACDMFSDSCIASEGNLELLDAMLDEVAERCNG